MSKLKQLHEEFISNANRPMSFDKLPIAPVPASVPIVAVEKWMVQPGTKQLTKNYRFRMTPQRNDFVQGLLDYESNVQHHAVIVVEEESVKVSLITKDIDQVTSIDKEYAKFCDVLYRDIVYNQEYDEQKQASDSGFTF